MPTSTRFSTALAFERAVICPETGASDDGHLSFPQLDFASGITYGEPVIRPELEATAVENSCDVAIGALATPRNFHNSGMLAPLGGTCLEGHMRTLRKGIPAHGGWSRTTVSCVAISHLPGLWEQLRMEHMASPRDAASGNRE